MKRIIQYLAVLLCGIVMALPAPAQMIQDPTEWKFTVKKQGASYYTLTATTTIKPKWHIYGVNPGGEGELIGTSIQFDPNGGKPAGKFKEVTPAVHTNLMDEMVNLHSDKATFSIDIFGKKGQTISGAVEYQACNDMMCLPPKKKTFSLKLP